MKEDVVKMQRIGNTKKEVGGGDAEVFSFSKAGKSHNNIAELSMASGRIN